jgi:hypothetical protein
MFRIARKTKRVTGYRDENIICDSFTHLVLNKFETEESAKQSLIDGINAGVLAVKTRSLTPSASRMRGAGEYEYEVLSDPRTEKRFYLRFVNEYDDYFNDEYTINGRTDWHEGPYEDYEAAKAAVNKWMQGMYGDDRDLAGYDWKANGDEYIEQPADHDGHGYCVSIREYEVVV